ncbi:expressed unknown protein [Seminavis robusta]|uniref:Uncharacterized protein n=1 Tax=Seminavis robusta TaxID=568900 RepID=A0A9N8HLR2_9STRA|nr:expressed unknown protein [Seminavis robusta]|eukprot:Sro937_g222230.1 n/a (247) ;mRNA; f:30174-30914
MASMWNKMKNTGSKAKLQGECALLDRELKARKMQFGVDLYRLLREQEKKSMVGGLIGGGSSRNSKLAAPPPGSFRGRIKDQWEIVRKDVVDMEERQEALRLEKTHEEVRRERGMPAVSAKERWQHAGQAVASRGKETKLMAQIALIDRDIQKRKELWGTQVYADAVAAIQNKDNKGLGIKSGVKNAVRGGLLKIDEQEQKIQHCVELAAREIGTMERSKATRISEIDALEEDGAISFRNNKNRTEI